MDYVFYVFLNAASKRRKKSRFFEFSKKNVKNVFSNYAFINDNVFVWMK